MSEEGNCVHVASFNIASFEQLLKTKPTLSMDCADCIASMKAVPQAASETKKEVKKEDKKDEKKGGKTEAKTEAKTETKKEAKVEAKKDAKPTQQAGGEERGMEDIVEIVYICLHCLHVGCSRGKAKHAEEHYTQHQDYVLACRFNGALHCYACDKDLETVGATAKAQLIQLQKLFAKYVQQQSRNDEEQKHPQQQPLAEEVKREHRGAMYRFAGAGKISFCTDYGRGVARRNRRTQWGPAKNPC